jgi:hypothetical protein
MVQPIGMIHNNGVTEAERGMQRDLLDQIANIRERLMDKIDSIAKIKSDGYIDMIYYFIIVSIMCFFVYIILSDIYKTLKFHKQQNEDSKRTSYGVNSNSGRLLDDNEYDDGHISINDNKNIKSSLDFNQRELETELKDLRDFKYKNKLDNNLYTSIDTKVINRENDNYEYPKEKNKTSFLNLMFEKPKYHRITNNTDGGFFEFI